MKNIMTIREAVEKGLVQVGTEIIEYKSIKKLKFVATKQE